MNSLVAFKQGTQAQFDALADKDVDVLYFCKDTQRIFKGSVEYTKSSMVVSNLPSVAQGVYGVLYVNTSDGIPRVFNGTEYVPIIKTYENTIDNSSSEQTIPTSKAVKEYVDNKNKNNITDINFDKSSGQVNLYKDGSTELAKSVSLQGVAHDPAYEQPTRKITIPVYGGEDLVIELGVDAVVESGLYNPETKSLDLTLTSGQSVSIPVQDLIKEYTVGNTSSVNMTLEEGNKFTASVKISSVSGNTLVLEEDGLYVPPGEGTQIVWTDISST